LGPNAVKFLCRWFSATGKLWSESVVALNLFLILIV